MCLYPVSVLIRDPCEDTEILSLLHGPMLGLLPGWLMYRLCWLFRIGRLGCLGPGFPVGAWGQGVWVIVWFKDRGFEEACKERDDLLGMAF